ncbi:putative ABC-2 type transporter, P-loop containing nucleoside triphosphate hydrolase [Helianthus anomalus]
MTEMKLMCVDLKNCTGEMLVGPANVFFMDEISTGLDSSTTCRITKFLRQVVHVMDLTMVISLLQPDPETYKLFDYVILMSEGQIVYQGPCQNVLEFFEWMGFKCPERKGVADFLQEVISKKDQKQNWFKKNQPYQFINVYEFSHAFKSFHIGQKLETDIHIPYDKSKIHPDALVKEIYGISNLELLKACFDREWLLSKRNSFLYIFKTFQLTFMSLVGMAMFLRTEMRVGSLEDGGKFVGALFFGLLIVMFNGMADLALTVMRLPVFYKQRDVLLYPAWAFALPIWVLRIPLSIMESGIWVVLTYYTIGFAPGFTRFAKQFLTYFAIHQMALSLFRLIAAVGRTEVLSNTLGAFTMLLIVTLGGFIIAKGTILILFIYPKFAPLVSSMFGVCDDSEPWMPWGFYVSPMIWESPSPIKKLLYRGALVLDICWSTPWVFDYLQHIIYSLGDAKPVIREENVNEGTDMVVRSSSGRNISTVKRRGMVLPFQPLSHAFNHVNYYIDAPYVSHFLTIHHFLNYLYYGFSY